MLLSHQAKKAAGDLHWRRVRRMLTFCTVVAGSVGGGWGLFSILRPNLMTTLLSLVSLLLAAMNSHLVRQQKIRLASYLYIAVIFPVLCLSATFIDVPTVGIPRSIHQFLLPLAVCSYLLMRNENKVIRHGVPIVCLLGFGWFSCAEAPTQTLYALPDSIRGPCIWIDEVLAMMALYVCLQLVQEDVLEQNKLEAELRNALIRNELVLHYQPQIHAGGDVVGVEALVRWKHPTRGLVPPNDFIPVVEAAGLMVPMGDWVLRTACIQLARWQSEPHLKTLTVAVNVSASQFAEAQFVGRVMEIVGDTGASPSLLKLELTESMLVENIDETIAKMAQLKRHGIRFSLDDFGTGFSSLTYLRRLPLDQLKIDQSFIRNILGSPEDASIARTVIALGHDLKLDVIAEGVETSLHRSTLSEMGCRLFQGYFFSKPVPVADLEHFVARKLEEQRKSNQRELEIAQHVT